MLRSIWSKTLRDYRTPILGWGLGLGFILFVNLLTFAQQGKDAGSQATIQQLALQFRFFGDPVAISTIQGFVTWRVLGLVVPAMLCIWTLLAGSHLLRGEEERGSLDIFLSTPRSRVRIFLEKFSGLVLAISLVGLLMSGSIILGEASAKVEVQFGRALLAGLNVALIGFVFATLALFFSQLFNTAGTAAGISGVLLAFFFLLDGTGRSIENGEWLQRFSPFHYYNANKPLIPTYEAHFADVAILIGLILLLMLLSIWLFVHRDIGGIAFPQWLSASSQGRRKTSATTLANAQNNPFLRNVFLRSIRSQFRSLLWWLLALALYTLWMTSLTPSLLEPLRKLTQGNPVIASVFNSHNIATNAGFLAILVFQFVSILSVIFALIQAVKWASNFDNGRMELVMSVPLSRTRLLLETLACTLLSALLAPVVIWLAILIGSRLVDLSIDEGQVLAACFGLLPLELLAIAFVYMLAERVSGNLIVSIATVYLIFAFTAELLNAVLKLPDWLQALSIFHLYGNPIINGISWGSSLAMTGIALLFLLLGWLQFRQADIQRGF